MDEIEAEPPRANICEIDLKLPRKLGKSTRSRQNRPEAWMESDWSIPGLTPRGPISDRSDITYMPLNEGSVITNWGSISPVVSANLPV